MHETFQVKCPLKSHLIPNILLHAPGFESEMHGEICAGFICEHLAFKR